MPTWFDDNVLRPETAGTVGAIAALFRAPGDNLRERAFNLTVGLGVAWFVAPGICEYFGMASKNGRMAVAFVVGLVGMNLAVKAMEYVKDTPFGSMLGLVRRLPVDQQQATKEADK